MESPTLETGLEQQELLKTTGSDQLEIHEGQESERNKRYWLYGLPIEKSFAIMGLYLQTGRRPKPLDDMNL